MSGAELEAWVRATHARISIRWVAKQGHFEVIARARRKVPTESSAEHGIKTIGPDLVQVLETTTKTMNDLIAGNAEIRFIRVETVKLKVVS